MKRPRSDIPQGIVERLTREYYQLTECVLDGRVVGQRAYTRDGRLVIETPLKDGKKHGREYVWEEDGALVSMEPYVDGKIHGVAKQYGRNGKIIGTYRLVHGTGFDIWRQEREDGSIYISEIHSLENGLPHGYEWWLNEDQQSVWYERHWYAGQYHGVEREWNSAGKLRSSYPKYWIRGEPVIKRHYVKAAHHDDTLPPFRESDNRPQRGFPPKLQRLLHA
jgi:hypothetical protein